MVACIRPALYTPYCLANAVTTASRSLRVERVPLLSPRLSTLVSLTLSSRHTSPPLAAALGQLLHQSKSIDSRWLFICEINILEASISRTNRIF